MNEFDLIEENTASGFDIDRGLFDNHDMLSSAYSSGFDVDHPMPTFDELRNAGFSDDLANQILYGDSHCYSQKELYEALYSDDPLKAYNDMMETKVNEALEKSDRIIADIQNEFGIY